MRPPAQSKKLNPLDIVVGERKRLGRWDATTYCAFMNMVFGHPTEQDQLPVKNPIRSESQDEYRHRPIGGVTRGAKFLVLRSMTPQPSRPEQCVVFTGDTLTHEIRAWPVIEILKPYYYRRSTKFVLSRSLSMVMSESGLWLGAGQEHEVRSLAEYAAPGDDEAAIVVGMGGGAGFYNNSADQHHTLGDISDFNRLVEAHKVQENAGLIAA